nr:SulP family inorganic anion transporter [Candidatus Gracilibacteria bacterium]
MRSIGKKILNKFTPFKSWIGKLRNIEILKADAIAGITGAIIVLPQGIAFATIAGLPPEYGLYTAMVTPIIAAIFGSSWHLVSGPTTAISLVIFSTISGFATAGSPEFIQLTLVLTFLAGIYQLVFGLVKLGKVVDFVSHTVVIGFTAGAALLIVTSQMKSIVGIKIPSGTHFLETWKIILENIFNFNIFTIIVGITTLAIAILVKKYFKKIPNLLVSLILGSTLAYFLKSYSDGLTFVPAIPSKLPDFGIPYLSFDNIKTLASSAFAVAILGLIEAVSISRGVASKSHQIINANQEFIGQGMSNVVGSFFSAYAGSGSFTRSGVNYSAGARTPMSAIFAALFLMIIVLLIAPLTRYISISAMAGVIVLVGYNLIDINQIKHVIKSSKSETSILAVTFFSTLFLELEFAIYLGIFLSLIIFLNRTSTPRIVTMLSTFNEEKNKKVLVGTCKVNRNEIDNYKCPQLEIIRIDMSIYFGSTNYVHEFLNKIMIEKGINNILILCSSVNFIDMTGMEMLEKVSDLLNKKGGGLYFLEVKTEVMQELKKSGFIKHVGEEKFFNVKKDAISFIYKKLNKDICKNCNTKVFTECK